MGPVKVPDGSRILAVSARPAVCVGAARTRKNTYNSDCLIVGLDSPPPFWVNPYETLRLTPRASAKRLAADLKPWNKNE